MYILKLSYCEFLRKGIFLTFFEWKKKHFPGTKSGFWGHIALYIFIGKWVREQMFADAQENIPNKKNREKSLWDVDFVYGFKATEAIDKYLERHLSSGKSSCHHH